MSRLVGRAGLPETLAPLSPPFCAPSIPASVADGSTRIIVQALDVSLSMGEADMGTSHAPSTRLDAAKSAVMQFTEAARFGCVPAQLALVAFAERATTVLPLTNGDTILKMAQAIASLRTQPCTNMEAALLEAERLLRPFAGQNGLEVHVLTDGMSNKGGNPLHVASSLKSMGCTVSFVGIGGSPSAVNEKLLTEAASCGPSGRPLYRFIKERDQLERHYQAMGDGITR